MKRKSNSGKLGCGTVSWFLMGITLMGLFLLQSDVAHAAAGQGGGLPYEGALAKLTSSATGPVGFSFSIIGIVAAGAVLIFGGDVSGFFRQMMMLVLVIALCLGAASILRTLFGTGATIAAATITAITTDVGKS